MKNGEFKIEDGIPMPPKHGNAKGYAEALKKLKVSQSLVLPVGSYSGAWGHAKANLGKGNFVIRAAKGGGFRVWRSG